MLQNSLSGCLTIQIHLHLQKILYKTNLFPERKRPNFSSFDGDGEVSVKEKHANEPEPKQRVKKGNLASSSPLLKPSKKTKFVVHAAGDGYRWRKYGQKMVKGNPYPRYILLP